MNSKRKSKRKEEEFENENITGGYIFYVPTKEDENYEVIF